MSNEAPDINLWESFAGKENTPEVLTEKAKLLALFLMRFAVDDAGALAKRVKEDLGRELEDKNYFAATLMEVLVFYLHFTDRLAYQMLPLPQRNFFMDVVLGDISEMMAQMGEKDGVGDAYRQLFVDAYDTRQAEYSQYKKIVPEEGEGFKDTLFWEAQKRVASVFGHGDDALVVMTVQIHFTTSLKVLQLPKLLKGS